MKLRSFATSARHRVTAAPKRSALAVGIGLIVVGLVVVPTLGVSTTTPSDAQLAAYIEKHAQSMTVSQDVAAAIVTRDGYAATPGVETLAAGGTNYDWAKLVMLYAGWPMSDNNVTVFTRWMRQENGADDWWNRNNPLNNGWGSGGGGGTGTYDNLRIAAQNAAEALHQNAGYAEIAASFAASAPTAVTELAIWNSPWATGHYANGAHWAYTPVPVVTATEGW